MVLLEIIDCTRKHMKGFLSVTVVIQLVLVACFIWFGWQAEQMMDKSGLGNFEEWSSLNEFAGIALYAAIAVWGAVLVLVAVRRSFRMIQAQLSIGLPPICLILGWLSVLLV